MQRLVIVFSLVCLAGPVTAQELKEEDVKFFEQKIRPVLAQKCYKCHAADAEKVKGGLLLDTREGTLAGGDSGAAIVPGDPDKSLLITAVRYNDGTLQMPPTGPLPEEQVNDLVTWVRMNAPDPRTTRPAPSPNGAPSYGGQGKNHWAFKPVKKSSVPEVKMNDWVATPVDAFIVAKLEEKNIPIGAPLGTQIRPRLRPRGPAVRRC